MPAERGPRSARGRYSRGFSRAWLPSSRISPSCTARCPIAADSSIPISASTHRVTKFTGKGKGNPGDQENKTHRRQKADLQQSGQDEQEHAIDNHGSSFAVGSTPRRRQPHQPGPPGPAIPQTTAISPPQPGSRSEPYGSGSEPIQRSGWQHNHQADPERQPQPADNSIRS